MAAIEEKINRNALKVLTTSQEQGILPHQAAMALVVVLILTQLPIMNYTTRK